MFSWVMYMIILETVKYVTITYDLGNIADWVSALATTVAVIVSLYLANFRDRPRIVITIRRTSCRVTNKSVRPVELDLKIIGVEPNYSFPLPPIHNKIENMRDEQPFNNDFISFELPVKNKRVLSAYGIDIISNSRYYFNFYKSNDAWKVKQYKFWLLWKFALIGRKIHARIQKN